MTKTLTTEAMQEIYEAAVREEATGNPDESGQEAFDLLCLLDATGGTGATIRKLIDMARAANREAQPVRYQYREIGEGGWRDCDKAQYDYCQRSPELDARIAPADPETAFPAARDKSQGWKIDPEYLQSIADAVGCSDDEGTPSMEMVEAVLLAAAPPAPAVVKLPTTRLWAGVVECYSKDDVISAMNTAGVEISND